MHASGWREMEVEGGTWLVGWLEGDGGGHVAGWTGGWLGLPITIGSPRLPIYILYIYSYESNFQDKSIYMFFVFSNSTT
jgi:hypothetical protein